MEEVKNYRETRHLRCYYTNEERLRMSDQLASSNQNLSQLEEEKKSIASEYKSRMDNIKANISRLADNIRAGYEERPVEVRVKFHFPADNVKTCVRTDTGEEWVENMVADDYNLFTQAGQEPEDSTFL